MVGSGGFAQLACVRLAAGKIETGGGFADVIAVPSYELRNQEHVS